MTAAIVRKMVQNVDLAILVGDTAAITDLEEMLCDLECGCLELLV